MIAGVIITLIYGLFVFVWFAVIFSSSFSPRCQTISGKTPVTILISLYNEELRVEQLICSLKSQTYKQFSVVLIDDGSTDATYTKLQAFATTIANCTVIKGNHCGKDKSINTFLISDKEIQGGQNRLILVTDADCNIPPTWVEAMVAEYESTNASLLIGPVKIDSSHPFQAVEFLSIQGVTLSSVKLGHPLICGGANIAFTTDAYKRVYESIYKGLDNGGDMFLLEAMKRANEPITGVFSSSAIVETLGKNTLSEFLSQRVRWFGKSGNYKDPEIIATGIIVLQMQLVLVLSLFFAPLYQASLLFWLLKFIIDLPLLLAVSYKFGMIKQSWRILPLSIIYPFYLFTVVLMSIKAKNKKR